MTSTSNNKNINKFVAGAVLFLVILFLYSTLAGVVADTGAGRDMTGETSNYSQDTLLLNDGESSTLDLPTTNEFFTITQHNVTRNNQTFIDCDGSNDYGLIDDNSTGTVSFWYNSSTSLNWQHVVNADNTNYTNATQVNPNEYPVWYNGSHYFLCKTNSTNFWEGSIDEIRIYNTILNSTDVSTLYSNGR